MIDVYVFMYGWDYLGKVGIPWWVAGCGWNHDVASGLHCMK